MLVLVDGATAVPLAPRVTTSASATATRGRTPAAWARSRRPPASTTRCSTIRHARRDRADRRRARVAAASTTAACSTPASWLTPDGPELLEYNVRFGDPEAQVVLPRLADDPFDLLHRGRDRLARRATPRCTTDAAVTVVLAAAGYPTAPSAGVPIIGPRRRRPARRAPRRTSSSSTPRRDATARAGVDGWAGPVGDRARRDGGRRPRPRLRRGGVDQLRGRPGPPRRRVGSDVGARVIPRYAPRDLAALFEDEARFAAMLEVELLAAEALEKTGVAPAGTAALLRGRPP